MLHILFGPDDFSLREMLENIKGELGDQELLAINTTVLEGQQLTLERLKNTCDTVPFMAQRRLVIVQGLLSRFDPKTPKRDASKSAVPEEWQALGGYISRMPPSTVLVLVEGDIRKNNPLLQKLAPQAVVRAFALLKGMNLQSWIRARVAREKGSISPNAVKLLAELVGENLGILAGEIDKLLLYASGRRIEEKDVQEIVSYAREGNIFAMTDAIVECRTSPAIRQLHQLLDEGAVPPYLLVMLARQLRLILQAKELDSERLSPAEMCARLGVSANYPLNRLLKQAKGYSVERLLQIYRKLLETDLAIKTGKWEEELALDLLVTELCQG